MQYNKDELRYKDPEKRKLYQREYKREYMRSHRYGNKPALTKEKQKKKDFGKAWHQAYRNTQARKLDEIFGTVCSICGRVGKRHLHEKNCEPHEKGMAIYLRETERFIRVCSRCHTGLHFAKEHLGLSWEQVKGMLV